VNPRQDVTESDGSVRPYNDTGFRMPPTESTTYSPRPNPPQPRTIDCLHMDDVKTTTPSSRLRGVNYITIDFDKVNQRHLNDIRRNIRVDWRKKMRRGGNLWHA
jgi:hypothetical protein